MNRVFLFSGLVLALGLVGGAGCLGEAPRDNPFDPESGRFVDEGGLEGRVTDRAGAPLADAEVHLIPPAASRAPVEMVRRTDAQGQFAIDGAPSAPNYTLRVRKEGYADAQVDSLAVEAGPTKAIPALSLNALPTFAAFQFTTIHVGRWWPETDLFFLEVTAEVDDPDGLFDIDGVWLDIPDLDYSVPLETLTDGRFDKSIQADSLPTAGLQRLMGQALRLRVRDKEGVVTTSAPRQLARVIEATPVAASPRDDALLATGQPTLAWEPFPQTFPFTYRIDVFRDEVNRDVRAAQHPDLSMNLTSLRLDAALPAGNYFWIVTVVDAFGNESRSKEAAFRIP